MKLNRFAAAPSIDSLVSRARDIAERTQNCENNPMQSRNGASHYPKTQNLVVRIGASGHEKIAAHLARPLTSSHPALALDVSLLGEFLPHPKHKQAMNQQTRQMVVEC